MAITSQKAKKFKPLSLDAVNFLAADVRGAVGPYLNVFLVTQQHWSQSEVGVVTTIGGLLGLALQTPIGAAIDELRAKRGIIIVGLAVLAIRAALYTVSDNSVWLIGVQLLDAVGAGIFGALTPLVIADIMRDTGRHNLAQGAIATMVGIGASSSGLAAGLIVDHFGYGATFLSLGVAALVALIVFACGMPETAETKRF
jgi:MFS family permease